jgi:hypothetical protein
MAKFGKIFRMAGLPGIASLFLGTARAGRNLTRRSYNGSYNPPPVEH